MSEYILWRDEGWDSEPIVIKTVVSDYIAEILVSLTGEVERLTQCTEDHIKTTFGDGKLVVSKFEPMGTSKTIVHGSMKPRFWITKDGELI